MPCFVSMATVVDHCIEQRPLLCSFTRHLVDEESGMWYLAEILTMSYPFVNITASHISLWLASFSRQPIGKSFKHLEEGSSSCCTHSNFASQPFSRHFKTGLHARDGRTNTRLYGRLNPFSTHRGENGLFLDCRHSLENTSRDQLSIYATTTVEKELTLSDWRPCNSAGPRMDLIMLYIPLGHNRSGNTLIDSRRRRFGTSAGATFIHHWNLDLISCLI